MLASILWLTSGFIPTRTNVQLCSDCSWQYPVNTIQSSRKIGPCAEESKT
jgi:hypothetical protein